METFLAIFGTMSDLTSLIQKGGRKRGGSPAAFLGSRLDFAQNNDHKSRYLLTVTGLSVLARGWESKL